MHCDDSLLSDFLDESSQLMERLSEDMLQLDELIRAVDVREKAAVNIDLLNNMFRSAHSIKGLSAMLGFNKINTLVHRVENVFDSARNQHLPISTELVDVVFRSLDCLSHLLDRVRSGAGDEDGSLEVVDVIDQLLLSSNCLKSQTTQADAERAVIELQPPLPARENSETISNEAISVATTLSPTECLERVFEQITDESEIPARYLAMFIDETELSLDRLAEMLVQGEAASSPATIDELLVTAHRIKGSAASLGLHRVAKLAHYMEDMLQELRDRGAPLISQVVDALLSGSDTIRHYVKSLQAGQPNTSGFAAIATELKTAHQAAAQNTPALPAWATALLQRCTVGTQPVFVGQVFFDPQLPLVGMKASLVYEKLTLSGRLFYCDPPEHKFDELDELSVLSFVLESVERLSAVQTKLQISGVTHVEILAAVVNPEEQAATPEALSRSAEPITPVSPSTEDQQSVTNPNLSTNSSGVVTTAKVEPAVVKENESKPVETLRVDVERLDQLMNLAGQLVINKARLNRIGDGLKHAIPSKRATQGLESILQRAQKMAGDWENHTPGSHANDNRFGSQLSSLVHDLQQMQVELRQAHALRNQLNDLFESLSQLDRVTDGLQKSVMDTRMVPIGPLFQRFKRVVRDITRGNGKEINLVINGEHTELDKRMIDELSDPLVHMVRNSADHGVESPEARQAQGKPRQGTITLNAFQRGSRVIIEVCDDGKGLDKDRILAKAIEKGIISPSDAERLTPQQIFALIWEPGFSTAEKITEISGRGMGMDIVRSKIEGIKGVIQIESTPGKGCKFIIVLPLTMAILPSLMVGIDGNVFALPLESVVEIVSVRSVDLATVHGVPTIRVRDRVISIAQLSEIFTWHHPAPPATEEENDQALVILEHEGREIGLFAHRLLGEEDVVIESMDEIYGEIPGIAGASILGDGRVSLILDVGLMMNMACRDKLAKVII